MHNLIWMSDLHFTAQGLVQGHDPRRRVDLAVTFVNAHYQDAQVCVISGDMVDRGTPEDYSALAERLAALNVAILPMVGNHDDREVFKATFPVPETCMQDFVQYSVATDDGLILCLDTLKVGSDAGELCADRLAWLEMQLTAAQDTPVYIFMHHPPLSLGLPMQDTDRLENGDAFLDLVTQFDAVKFMFIGHVHRPISGVVCGVPYCTMRSVLYQAPPPQPAWNWDTFKPANEAPNLGVVELNKGDVRVQYVQCSAFEDGVQG